MGQNQAKETKLRRMCRVELKSVGWDSCGFLSPFRSSARLKLLSIIPIRYALFKLSFFHLCTQKSPKVFMMCVTLADGLQNQL